MHALKSGLGLLPDKELFLKISQTAKLQWMSTTSELSTRALEAAVAVAKAHGLACKEPIVLADRSNVIVHLSPAPVVARVATTTALVRPEAGAWLEREITVAGFLAERGVAVVPPSDELPPGTTSTTPSL